MGKNTMRSTVLPLDHPTNTKQGSEDVLSFG